MYRFRPDYEMKTRQFLIIGKTGKQKAIMLMIQTIGYVAQHPHNSTYRVEMAQCSQELRLNIF
jgi:hypothetical protein